MMQVLKDGWREGGKREVQIRSKSKQINFSLTKVLFSEIILFDNNVYYHYICMTRTVLISKKAPLIMRFTSSFNFILMALGNALCLYKCVHVGGGRRCGGGGGGGAGIN